VVLSESEDVGVVVHIDGHAKALLEDLLEGYGRPPRRPPDAVSNLRFLTQRRGAAETQKGEERMNEIDRHPPLAFLRLCVPATLR
jgi:hypothetical protein